MAQIEELDYEQVTQGLKDGSLIYLEVRNLSELQTDGKIVGSVVVPLPELEEAFKLDEDQFAAKYNFPKPAIDATNVVVGCRSGRRAVTAIEQLQKQGYQYLKVYKGSFLEWQAKGGLLIKE